MNSGFKWSICYTNKTAWKHCCGFYVWNTCIEIWVVTRITSDKLFDQEPIPCLQQKCNEYIGFKEIQKWLEPDQMLKVCEAYNNNYICMIDDITRCPKSGWDFAGVIGKDWNRPFECNKCGYEWREYSQLSSTELTYKSLSDMSHMQPESLNYITKLFYSHSWPCWGMTIQKQEGWSHMMCQHCSYEFCWECLGHYPGYVHEPYAIWWLRPILNKVLYFMAGLMLLWFFASKFKHYDELFVRMIQLLIQVIIVDIPIIGFIAILRSNAERLNIIPIDEFSAESDSTIINVVIMFLSLWLTFSTGYILQSLIYIAWLEKYLAWIFEVFIFSKTTTLLVLLSQVLIVKVIKHLKERSDQYIDDESSDSCDCCED